MRSVDSVLFLHESLSCLLKLFLRFDGWCITLYPTRHWVPEGIRLLEAERVFSSYGTFQGTYISS